MSENKCPWCDHEISEIWEYELNDGDEHEAECPNCDKKIEINCSVTYSYNIKAIGCEKHKLDMGHYWFSGANYLNLRCVECKNEFYDSALPGGRYPKLTTDQYEFVGRAIVEAAKFYAAKALNDNQDQTKPEMK